VLLHIHRAARPLPVDAGHEDIEIVGKIARETFRVAPLNCKIKLAFERLAQLADDLNRPVATDFGYLARLSRILRSESIFASIPGRRIFRITAVPLASLARCICAIDAAA
jgi:hypothetical protein